MTPKPVVLLAVAVIFGTLGSQLSTMAQNAQPNQRLAKWEYKSMDFFQVATIETKNGTDNPFIDGLNKLSEEGWELVTIVPNFPPPAVLQAAPQMPFQNSSTVYLKRAK